MTNVFNAILILLAIMFFIIVLIIGHKVHNHALQVSNKKDKSKENTQ